MPPGSDLSNQVESDITESGNTRSGGSFRSRVVMVSLILNMVK